jgi:hypothetical protein
MSGERGGQNTTTEHIMQKECCVHMSCHLAWYALSTRLQIFLHFRRQWYQLLLFPTSYTIVARVSDCWMFSWIRCIMHSIQVLNTEPEEMLQKRKIFCNSLSWNEVRKLCDVVDVWQKKWHTCLRIKISIIALNLTRFFNEWTIVSLHGLLYGILQNKHKTPTPLNPLVDTGYLYKD